MSTGKKARVNLKGPNGEKFISYVSAWEWHDKNPHYIVKEEVSSDRELQSATIEDQHDPVEITPKDASQSSKTTISESPKKKSMQRKPPKKFVPTPVLKATSKKQSELQPAQDSTAEVPESQNLLAMESETEYQSQSLLQPAQPVTNPNKVALKQKSPKVACDRSNLNKEVAKSKKSLPKSESSSIEEGAQSVPSSNTNSDTLRTSSIASSDSSDDSDNEENIPKVSIPAKQTEAPPIPPSSDSSSYDSDTSDDEQAMVLSKTPTKPSETVVSKPEESSDSDSSDTDSSEESSKTSENIKVNAVSGSVTVPSLSGDKCSEKVGDSAAQIKTNSKPALKQSSSSSSSDSEEARPKTILKKKKMTKTKNSPKPDTHKTNKGSTSLTEDKSTHLSTTVMSGVERLKDKMSVPDGISPILKSRHKSKAVSKENEENEDSSYYDKVMANSKIGSQISETTQATIESGTSDKNSNVKDGKSVKNDKNANKKKKKKDKPPGFL